MTRLITLTVFLLSAAVVTGIMNEMAVWDVPAELMSEQTQLYRELKAEKRAYMHDEFERTGAYSQPGVDWYIVPRTLSGKVPISKGLEAARSHMLMQEQTMTMRKTQEAGRWTNIGPFTTAGRSRVVVYHPTNPQIMYTGAASGGVWKTTNGGQSWEPKTDHFSTLAIGHIAIDKQNPNIVFAGTGEGSDNFDRVFGDGLHRSTDGGETWTNIMASRDVEDDECINKVELHPISSDTIFAAIRGGTSGLYKTTDGGASWRYVLGGVPRDVRVDPIKTNRVYVAVAHNYGSGNNGIFISDHNGDPGTFKRADSLLPRGDSIGNISMDISQSTPGYMVAIMSKSYAINRTPDGYIDNNDFLGVFRSTDYGESWERTAEDIDGGLRRVFRGQADYNMYLRIHPADHNYIYIGGIHNWRSTDFGDSFSQTSNYDTWVDLHYADFNPNDPDEMAVASDGGVFITDDNRAGVIAWDEIGQDLVTMQFYAMNYARQATRRVAGGTQDRRNNILQPGASDWDRLTYGGDGGYVAFDYNDEDIYYISSQYGNLARTTDGGASFRRFTDGLDGTNRYNFGFVTPFVMHPDDPKVLFIGGQRVFRLNGETWEKISNNLTGDSSSFGAFQDMAFSRNNPDVLWGVTGRTKRVFRTTNANAARAEVEWSLAIGDDVRYRVPGIYLSAIAVHPDSGDVAYVGTSEFQSRSGIYRTTDGGSTWEHMTGSTPETTLPSVPIGAIAIYEPDPNIVFAGTDVGVYISRNRGGDWTPFNNNLPMVVVDDLKITEDGILYAATHGRGMWMRDISLVSVERPNEAPSSFSLGDNYPNPFNPSTTIPYTLHERERVLLQVFDSNGRVVKTLYSGMRNPGEYKTAFKADGLPSGVYYYKLQAGRQSLTRKMVLMK